MSYLSRDVLEAMGFAFLGKNVLISDKASIYGAEEMKIGNQSRIDDYCVISGKVDIGRNVHIAPFCLVSGGTAGITLEDFSGLAYRVSIFAQSDDYSGATLTNPTVPARFKAETRAPVRIGRHGIIGAGSIICPGVDLGDGSAVGAGSLVLASCPPSTILVGSPARKLKDRSRELFAIETDYLNSPEANPSQ